MVMKLIVIVPQDQLLDISIQAQYQYLISPSCDTSGSPTRQGYPLKVEISQVDYRLADA